MFCAEDLVEVLEGQSILQINHTFTKNLGTVRGMHYQLPPFSETKVISCQKGRVFDVALDLRSSSKTFMKSFVIELSEDNHLTLCIPKGFAHGFQALTNNCEMLYLHTEVYSADFERGINALDKKINIEWPLPVTERSARDLSHPMLTEHFHGIEI